MREEKKTSYYLMRINFCYIAFQFCIEYMRKENILLPYEKFLLYSFSILHRVHEGGKMLSALLSGESIKRNGTIRKWNCVEYHGQRKNVSGGFMLRVYENNRIKQIDLKTFSGTILNHDNEIVFINGKPVSSKTYYLPF
jgi:hypothetical protein